MPCLRSFATTASMPFFSMVRSPLRGDAQGDPALLVFEPEALHVQVRQEAAALLVVRVRDAVTDAGFLPVISQTRDIADLPCRINDLGDRRGRDARKGAALYQPRRQPRQAPSNPARAPQRNSTAVPDDQVVEHPHVDQGQGFLQPPGDEPRPPGSAPTTPEGWLWARMTRGGVADQRLPHHLPRMDARTVDRAPEHLLEDDQAVRACPGTGSRTPRRAGRGAGRAGRRARPRRRRGPEPMRRVSR